MNKTKDGSSEGLTDLKGWTHKYTDRWTDRRTEWQTDEQNYRRKGRQTKWRTDRMPLGGNRYTSGRLLLYMFHVNCDPLKRWGGRGTGVMKRSQFIIPWSKNVVRRTRQERLACPSRKPLSLFLSLSLYLPFSLSLSLFLYGYPCGSPCISHKVSLGGCLCILSVCLGLLSPSVKSCGKVT